MLEARQIDCVRQKLHAHQLAAFRQRQILESAPVEVRQVLGALGGIGTCLQRLVRRAERKGEACAEAMCRAHQLPRLSAFEIRSAPIAK